MSVNDLSFNQVATLLNAMEKQVTGRETLTATSTSEFVSVAQSVLKTGYDPVLKAISQMIGRTIFSTRPYKRKFSGLNASEQRFAYITRKISQIDRDAEENEEISSAAITDGQSVDMYKVNKPNPLQMLFYGQNVYQRHTTIYKNQLDVAFTGPQELAAFWADVMTHVANQKEQDMETLARFTIANFIGGKVKGDTASCIHLLTEYNAECGESFTATDIYKPANFKPFMQWVYARIAQISALMTERTSLYQIQLTDKPINRHTDYADQRVYLYAPARYQADMMALADIYHDNYLRLADTETVNFWQAVDSPATINVTPTYLQPDGTLTTADAPVATEPIFGVIFDRDAMGYTLMNQWESATPLNSAGGYSNLYFHYTGRYWNDFTEKGVVLLLD